MTRGVVRLWDRDEGWGVVESSDHPDGCWVHFSVLRGLAGYHELTPESAVEYEAEQVDQDGYRWRAVWAQPA
ncbi:MAG: cold-shock protein [Nocardioides sp.]